MHVLDDATKLLAHCCWEKGTIGLLQLGNAEGNTVGRRIYRLAHSAALPFRMRGGLLSAAARCSVAGPTKAARKDAPAARRATEATRGDTPAAARVTPAATQQLRLSCRGVPGPSKHPSCGTTRCCISLCAGSVPRRAGDTALFGFQGMLRVSQQTCSRPSDGRIGDRRIDTDVLAGQSGGVA
jgi:hypothetical protein